MPLHQVPPIPDLFHGKKQTVSVEAALSQKTVFVDVRTPKEFEESAILGAVNLPLFSNPERSQIGILYKQIGQQAAIELGKSLVDSRLSDFVSRFLPFQNDLLTVYCARGGMRSAAVVQLLMSLGFHVQQLEKGYKGYRHYVLQALETRCPHHLIVLHGQTGVGKTRLLKKLPHSIDLEDLAQHRSSLFGAVNKQPRAQKNFESHLVAEFCKHSAKPALFVEGESRKVGKVFIPASLWEQMHFGLKVVLTASLETRIARIIEDYVFDSKETFEELKHALHSLRGALSHAKVNWLIQCLEKEDYAPLVKTLLTDYYDPRYRHSMKHHTYVLEVSGENLDKAAEELLAFQESHQASFSSSPPSF